MKNNLNKCPEYMKATAKQCKVYVQRNAWTIDIDKTHSILVRQHRKYVPNILNNLSAGKWRAIKHIQH